MYQDRKRCRKRRERRAAKGLMLGIEPGTVASVCGVSGLPLIHVNPDSNSAALSQKQLISSFLNDIFCWTNITRTSLAYRP